MDFDRKSNPNKNSQVASPFLESSHANASFNPMIQEKEVYLFLFLNSCRTSF